MQLSVTIK